MFDRFLEMFAPLMSLPHEMADVALGLCGLVAGVVLYRTKIALGSTRNRLDKMGSDSYFSRLVADSTFDGLVVTSLDGRVLWCNAAYERLVGRRLTEIRGLHPAIYTSPPDSTPNEADIAGFRYETDGTDWSRPHLRLNARADGTTFWNEMSTSFRTDPSGREVAILVCRDATEQVARQEALERARSELENSVRTDSLTGIPNRNAMNDRIGEIFAETCANNGKPIGRTGIMRIDLDYFKEVNDTFGHAAGDAVLVHVARVLRQRLRVQDFVARTGGDEFIAICQGMWDLEDLAGIARELASAAATPFRWREKQLSTTLSIGIAMCAGDPPCGFEELLNRSDVALYEAKKTGRSTVAVYDDQLHQRQKRLIEIGRDLAAAVRNHELTFAFQPLFDPALSSVSGVETLVRWTHPVHGAIGPDDFLPIARTLGLMTKIDMAAVEAAVAIKDELSKNGFANMRISLNASAEALSDPSYCDFLLQTVQAAGHSPSDYSVEVLETVMLDIGQPNQPQIKAISRIFDMGFKTYLDDFGIGYAGLAHLSQLRLSGVKIDRSLIDRVGQDRATTRIVQSVCDLCGDLGLDVVGEGVERDDVGDTLFQMGCNILQGYAISRPLPKEDLINWLVSRPQGALRAASVHTGRSAG